MADKDKPEPKKVRERKYGSKLKVNGSFMDIIKASVKHADKDTPKPKE